MRERTRIAMLPARAPVWGAMLTLAAGAAVLLAACGGDSKPSTSDQPAPSAQSGESPGNAPAVAPNTGKRGADDGTASMAGDYGGSGLDSLRYGWGGCPAPLPGALTGGTLDPSLGGFKASLLSTEFQLAGFGLMAQQPCPGSGETGGVTRAFESRWIHTTGIGLQVNQRENATPVPNTLTETMARFSANGFEYDVSVLYNPGYYDPASSSTARDLPTTPGSAPSSGSGGTGIAVPPAPDAGIPKDALPVLEKAIGQLAPGLPLTCFYREQRGDWGDLAAMGIGDPRPAVPAGYGDVRKEIVRLVEPAAGCSTPAPEGWPTTRVSIMWGKGNEILSMDVSSVQGDLPGAGRFGSGSASWTNGKLVFYLSWALSLNDASARALAKAIDPAFDQACFVETKELTTAEFTALGLTDPALPSGYRLEGQRQAYSLAPSAACPGGAAPGYFAKWMLFSESVSGVIEAAVFSGPRPAEYSYIPNVEGQTLYWKDAKGREYYVVGYKADYRAHRTDLLAVAKSIDPTFDERNLLPLPANPGDPIAKPASSSRTP